jgi:hypothetical protein
MRTPTEIEIDTTATGAPEDFEAAGINLTRVNRIPVIIQRKSWPWPEDTIYLFDRNLKARRDSAQIFIHIFPLPKGAERFRQELDLYRKQKKSFLVEGVKFDPNLLIPRSTHTDFERETFQTRDGIHRRRIVHLFTAPARAVILVYSLNNAHFISNKFFRHISENLEIGRS